MEWTNLAVAHRVMLLTRPIALAVQEVRKEEMAPVEDISAAGARTPEELETRLEDALLMRDQSALAELFSRDALLVAGERRSARGRGEIAPLALMLWGQDAAYLAAPRQVLVTRDIAMVVADGGVNVLRRDDTGAWMFAIVWQTHAAETGEESA